MKDFLPPEVVSDFHTLQWQVFHCRFRVNFLAYSIHASLFDCFGVQSYFESQKQKLICPFLLCSVRLPRWWTKNDPRTILWAYMAAKHSSKQISEFLGPNQACSRLMLAANLLKKCLKLTVLQVRYSCAHSWQD